MGNLNITGGDYFLTVSYENTIRYSIFHLAKENAGKSSGGGGEGALFVATILFLCHRILL
jgi:hypothetical protein